MTEKTSLNIQESSAEKIALELFELIASAERKTKLHSYEDSQLRSGWQTFDRKYVLDTYAECLDAVRGARLYLK